MKKLARYCVGELPLIQSIIDRINLRDALHEFIPQQNNEEIAPADVLILLIFNLATGKLPLYELNDWVRSLHLRCIGYEHYKEINFTDDRFGKALDRLYSTDRLWAQKSVGF